MTYNYSKNGAVYGKTTWVSGAAGFGFNATDVASIDADNGRYVFNAAVGQSSGFIVTGSMKITGSQAGGGPDGTLFTVEAGGSGRDIDGKVALHVQASGGFGRVGIGKSSPKVELDVGYDSVSDPNNFAPDSGGGEVVFFASSSHPTLTAGALYYMNDTSSWQSASAHSTGSGADRLLAISLGTSPQDHGMLIRGWFNATTFFTGAFSSGAAVYIHSGTAGYMNGSPPAGESSYSRIVGYGSANSNLIYFNPSSNWIELTGS